MAEAVDSKAVTRLAVFEAFVKDASQQLATNAENQLVAAVNKLALITALTPELKKIDADLSGLTSEQSSLISEFSACVDKRLLAIKQSLSNRVWITPADMPTSPEAIIGELKASLEARTVTEESAHDPDTRKKLMAERSELEARDWLSGIKADVLAHT